MQINGQDDKVTRNSEGLPKFTLEIHAKVTPATVDNQARLCLNSKDFPDSSVGKESSCNAGDPGSIPGSRISAGDGID